MSTKIRIPVKEFIYFLKEISEEKKKEIEATKKEKYVDSLLTSVGNSAKQTLMSHNLSEIFRYISDIQKEGIKYNPLIDEFKEDIKKLSHTIEMKSAEIYNLRRWIGVPSIEELNNVQNILKKFILAFRYELDKVNNLINILQKEANKHTGKIFNMFQKKVDESNDTFKYDFIIPLLKHFKEEIIKGIEGLEKDIPRVQEFIEYLQLGKN
jgi:hypothetical protein